MIDCGIIILKNFKNEANWYDKFEKDENMKLMAYYVMPKFEMNLSCFLKNQKGLQRIDSILTVSF